MNRAIPAVFALIAVAVVTYFTACFQVSEWQQAIVTQFGKPIHTVTEPGLHFKIPLVQTVQYFEKRLLEYDASAKEVLTRDKQQLLVDNYSRWKIVDPLKFYQTVVTIAGAQSRLDDIIYSNLREAIGRRTLGDIVSGNREEFMAEVTKDSDIRAAAYGVKIIDVRIKRADLPEKNEQNIFSRMRTERERQAKKFRAEGDEEARKIRSTSEKERRIIVAESKRTADIKRGEAEALSAAIFAKAYERDPEFYAFIRTLDAYKRTLKDKTTIVLDPTSEFFELLQSSQ